jgi:hypothetical protein
MLREDATATSLASLHSLPTWSDAAVGAARLEIEDVPLLTIGGGFASFALIDRLRTYGVPAADVRVVGPHSRPYEDLRNLMRHSQIADHDQLRSDSMSRADNIWGFPGYAIEHAIARRSIRPLWNVLTEPLLTEYFNPTPAQVFRGVDREAARIGWSSMLIQAHAHVVRRRREGGYLTLVSPTDGAEPFVIRSRHVHLATGYPALNYPPEVSAYRARHNEYVAVVNAYERHEHVYQVLCRRPGTVAIRGAGITASRVLERLLRDRRRSGQDVEIVHLMRTYVDGADGPWWFRRPGGEGWSYQAFNFPKAATAGQLAKRLRRMSGRQRAAYIAAMGGTTSPRRRRWQDLLEPARSGGYYRALQSDITGMTPTGKGSVALQLSDDPTLEADFVIDCTGLKADLRESPLLSDLLDAGGGRLNPLGGLDVGQRFEVRGASSRDGRLYASGMLARGGYLAPVDSFWGCSHAASLIADDLTRLGFCPRFGPTRSAKGWFKWLTGKAL